MFNTYAQMLELVRLGYAKVSTNGHLDTFKYAKKVMFKYLWDEIPGIFECRGHTYDNRTGQLVVAAPTKSFNYLEKDTWKDIPLDTPVTAYKKYNGFLACVSWQDGVRVISTTGSTKSDFVKMADEVLKISPQGSLHPMERFTDFYEIIHADDPHIVDDGPPKAHYLGTRNKKDGEYIPMGRAYPTTLAGAIEMAKTDRGEGFMLYREDGSVCKLKTPYYVGKKKLMRANKAQVDAMYADPKDYTKNLPAMWSKLPGIITAYVGKEEWLEMNDQQRRECIEQMEKENLND